MTPPATRLGKPPPAPSLQLLRLLRHCVQDKPPEDPSYRNATIRKSSRNGVTWSQKAQLSSSCQSFQLIRIHISRFQKFSSFPFGRRSGFFTADHTRAYTPFRRAYASPTRPAASAAVASLSIEELESFVDTPEEPEELAGIDKVELGNIDKVRWSRHRVNAGDTNQSFATLPLDPLPGVSREHVVQYPVNSFEPALDPKAVRVPQMQQKSITEGHTFKITKHLAENTEIWKQRQDSWTRREDIRDENVERIVSSLEEQLARQSPDLKSVFETYSRLPEPRISYLYPRTVTSLLQMLRQVQVKTAEIVKQYFAVMDDMVRSGLAPSMRDFTSGLVFVGKTAGINPGYGLARALKIFRRMEQYGIRRADIFTFNTLGDLALRAHRLDVFRDLLRELSYRKIPHDRYTWLLKLRYWGLRNNANRIKRTYREMVAEGELIDTVVLNCVIRQLIIVHDAFTAEKTFERMKDIESSKPQEERATPPEEWNKQIQLAKMLRYASWLFRHDHENLKKLQHATPTSPNTYTYRMIVKHHCITTGNLHRVVDLLEEMQQRGLLITRPIFWMVFNGFERNTSGKFSPWNISQLDSMFELFVHYVKLSRETKKSETSQKYDYRCDLNGRTIEKLVRAYAQHSDGARLRQIWETIRPMWKATKATIENMESYVVVLENTANPLRRHDKRAAALRRYVLSKLRHGQWDDGDDDEPFA
ncbi:hypothetical protein K461DRAFT_280539 [Myriangium duriaei CBS 260.36]|uniref:Pentatricopeptide repeat domain-containing protein n=1 Tax=Myriangium duriaei CBS 260.36 TaxID=1168546 RepID=A0A9P4IZI5_9PEZI|nr:hypothetical protein K461DRAFT_280539 [Myriangium duriaei CBS 260.36]